MIKWFGLLAAILPVLWYPKPGLAADKIRIGYGAPTVTMSPLWIAQEGGIFPRNNLEVEVLYLESALVQRALIAGEIQFGEMTGALLSAPRLQGADVVMVAGFVDRLLFRLLVRPDIRTPADLKARRIGTSRFGAAIDRATRLLLARLGINPERDVTFIQIGGEPTLLSALLGNVIDATLLQPPRHRKAVEAGMTVLANLEEMNIPFQHTGLCHDTKVYRQKCRCYPACGQIVRGKHTPDENQSGDRKKSNQQIHEAER